MYVSHIKLSNFRNYTQQDISLGSGLNVLYGSNASGKTNMLESIYVLAIGKSPRATKDKELIKWDSEASYIRADVSKKYSTHKVEMYLDKVGKRIAVDTLPIGRLGELMGAVNVVYFSPDEMRIIKQSPQERRRFVDISLSQQSKIYYYALSRYGKILQARNKLLKDAKALNDTLPIWDEQLAEYGAKIIKARREYTAMLSIEANKAHTTLTSGEECLTVEYDTQCDGETEEEIKAQLLALYLADREKDIHLLFTSSGPHRDDLIIKENGVDLRKYGSQGQQRTASLSLKLAELEIFKQVIGEYPILLLDDVLSELDDKRQNALMQAVAGVQTILTCTSYDGKILDDTKFFAVKNGVVTPMTNK